MIADNPEVDYVWFDGDAEMLSTEADRLLSRLRRVRVVKLTLLEEEWRRWCNADAF